MWGGTFIIPALGWQRQTGPWSWWANHSNISELQIHEKPSHQKISGRSLTKTPDACMSPHASTYICIYTHMHIHMNIENTDITPIYKCWWFGPINHFLHFTEEV